MNKQNIYSLVIVFFLCIGHTSAQLELKIQPLALISGLINVNVETVISNEVSAELDLGYETGLELQNGIFGDVTRKSGYKVRVLGKYFFNPDVDAEGWYTGLYLGNRLKIRSRDESRNEGTRYSQFQFSSGVTFGVKWVGDNRLILDFSAGVGRAFLAQRTYDNITAFSENPSNRIDGFGRVSAGYRF